MHSDVTVEGKSFKYDRVKVYFIFSFCLANRTGSNVAAPLFEDDLASIVGKHGWTDQLPNDRRGAISPFLSVKTMRAFKNVPRSVARIGSQQVELSAQFRLFAVGGTLTICFDLAGNGPRSLGVKNTHDLMQVLGMSFDSQCNTEPIVCSEGTQCASLYAFFKRLLDAEREGLRAETRGRIDLHDLSDDVLDANIPIPQSPWMVTVFKVSGAEQQAFCDGSTVERVVTPVEKARSILPYYHEIGPILFRSVSGKNFPMEPTYRGQEAGIDAGFGTQLSNMHLDARMFACSSRRNVVCITGEMEGEPYSYFLPGILTINEQVRSRWHSLIVLNRTLDGILLEYGRTRDIGDFESSRETLVESRRMKESEHVRRILLSRQWISRVLDDPGIYTIAGDALAALYARGKEVFCLDELKTLLLQKADLVDRLHADEQQLTWISRA
jgi:hypothetical protein